MTNPDDGLVQIPPAVRLKRYAFTFSYGVVPPVSENGIARGVVRPHRLTLSPGLVSGARPRTEERAHGLPNLVFNIQDPGIRILHVGSARILASGSSNRRVRGKNKPSIQDLGRMSQLYAFGFLRHKGSSLLDLRDHESRDLYCTLINPRQEMHAVPRLPAI